MCVRTVRVFAVYVFNGQRKPPGIPTAIPVVKLRTPQGIPTAIPVEGSKTSSGIPPTRIITCFSFVPPCKPKGIKGPKDEVSLPIAESSVSLFAYLLSTF